MKRFEQVAEKLTELFKELKELGGFSANWNSFMGVDVARIQMSLGTFLESFNQYDVKELKSGEYPLELSQTFGGAMFYAIANRTQAKELNLIKPTTYEALSALVKHANTEPGPIPEELWEMADKALDKAGGK